MARRSRKKGGRSGAGGALLLAALLLMALSLAVRWSGIGAGAGAPAEVYRIEVLNGTGEAGLARSVTAQLRRMGIDVLLEGNADRFDFSESLLIDRKGNPALIKRMQRRLGVRRVLLQVQHGPQVDATLVVGYDREKLRLQH